MNIFIPSEVNMILDRLERAGHEAYIVGGCVRDSIMGAEPSDYDIATSARPERVKEVFCGENIIETGLKHGTLTLNIGANNYEITTFRSDGEYLNNRSPESVRFESDIREDLSRRDFTVNAMAYNPSEGLIDLFGGETDIKNGIIRCVGSPHKRFEEDALRILRALRFASVLGFEIDESTKRAAIEQKELISALSSERIFSEFKKFICGENAAFILDEFREVFAVFIPELKPTFGFDQHNKYHCFDVWKHTVTAVSNTEPDVELRIAALFHDIGKPETFFMGDDGNGHFYNHAEVGSEIARRIFNRLKCDNDIKGAVCTLVKYHGIEIINTRKIVKRRLNKFGVELFNKLIKLKIADVSALNPEYTKGAEDFYRETQRLTEEIILDGDCFSLSGLEINGKDLIEAGIAEGREIGAILKAALKAVIDGSVSNQKDELMKFALAAHEEYDCGSRSGK